MSIPAPPKLSHLRTDHVGSLLRPAALKDAYRRHEEQALSTAQLEAIQDQAVTDVIRTQEAHGVEVVTDGEFRRINFQDSVAASVSGFAATANTSAFNASRASGGTPLRRWDPGYEGAGPAIVRRRPVTGRLRLAANQPLSEYLFAREVATRPVKVTVIGPDRVLQRVDLEHSTDAYPDAEAFVADLVAVGRQLIAPLVSAGCSYLQIDEPGYTAYVDPPSVAELAERGLRIPDVVARSIRADNAWIEGFEGVTFGVHLCRGNQRSMWHREGAYDAVAEQLFQGLAHERLLLEYDSERAGGFEPLRFVPKDKVVVLGLVSSKTAELESPDDLKRRIEEAARYLPLEQLALSPQCGFASDLEGNLLSEDDQWRKLDLVRDVAASVWGA